MANNVSFRLILIAPPFVSPRIIHIPLSGGDRKAQAKGIRYAHGIHES
jgi:hypothetical protein